MEQCSMSILKINSGPRGYFQDRLPQQSQPSELANINWSAAISRNLQFVTSHRVGIRRFGKILASSVYSGNAGLQSYGAWRGYRISGNSADHVRFDTGLTSAGSDPCTVEFLVVASSYPSLAALGGLSAEGYTNGAIGGGGGCRAVLSFGGSAPCNMYYYGGGADYDSGVPFTVNTVQHIFAMKFAGATTPSLSIWRNGKQIILGGSGGNFGTSGPYFYLGARYTSGAATIDGIIVKAAFYDTILTATEIASLTANQWQQFEDTQ